MSVETATYIPDLAPANPGSTDQCSQGDDHLRLIKQVLKNTFPNWISAALASTQAQVDAAVNAVVLGTVAALHSLGSVGAPSISFVSDTNTGIFSPGADQLTIATNGTAAFKVKADQSVEAMGNATVDGNLTVSGTSGISGPAWQLKFIGEMFAWSGDTLPGGDSTHFAWCNGASLDRTTYATLFAVTGTKYGNVDGTHFNLPDLLERVPVGNGTMGGVSSPGRIPQYTTGTTGTGIGEGKHTLAVGELPAHTHNYSGTSSAMSANASHAHSVPYTTAVAAAPSGGTMVTAIGSGGSSGNTNNTNIDHNHTYSGTTDSGTGGAASHNVVQPGLVCNWVIRIA